MASREAGIGPGNLGEFHVRRDLTRCFRDAVDMGTLKAMGLVLACLVAKGIFGPGEGCSRFESSNARLESMALPSLLFTPV
jgi:hypothetical protein